MLRRYQPKMPKPKIDTQDEFIPSDAAKKAAARLRKVGHSTFRTGASKGDPTFKQLEKKVALEAPLDVTDRDDLQLLYREYARLSQLLRQISAQKGLLGFQAARSLFAETVRNTQWITDFPVAPFRSLAATAPKFPILATPGDPPKMAVQAEAKLARVYREEVPQKKTKSAKIPYDEYTDIATDALYLMAAIRFSVSKEQWSQSTRAIRKLIREQVLNKGTCDALVARMKQSDRPLSKKRDRVIETVMKRMKGLLGF